MIELEKLITPEEYAKFVWELGGGYFTDRKITDHKMLYGWLDLELIGESREGPLNMMITYRPGPVMYMVANFDTNPSYLELSEEFSKLVNQLAVYLKNYSDGLLSDLSKMEIKYES